MSDDELIDDLLMAWEEDFAVGRVVELTELCRSRPDLLDRVATEVTKLKRMRGLLAETQPQVLCAEMPAVGPRYVLVRLHAKGGLGEVFIARDTELNRDVAVKRLQDRRAADPECRRRFLREAEVTGRLEHPGIVPVYGLGAGAGGYPFYAMRLLRGQNLRDAIEAFFASEHATHETGERALAQRDLLMRFVAACNAVAYAHSKGVIHRDLKPANIMLGDFGETLVVDWGLAGGIANPMAAIDAAETPALAATGFMTVEGQTIGTPAYMSPEQADGRWSEVGPATDVFSLGATLYHLLTGWPPFIGASAVTQAGKAAFTPPRQVRPDVPHGIEAICLKAMAKDVVARYATAVDLARDVERWLADEPVAAFRDPFGVRAWRWVRRHRTLVTASAAGLLVALAVGTVALAVTVASNRRTKAARNLAEANFQLALETNVTIGDVGDEIASMATTDRAAVERVLVRAEVGYARLAEKAPDSPQVAEARAKMLIGMARLDLALARTRRAAERAADAIQIYGHLAGRATDEHQRRIGLARGLYWFAVAQLRQGQSRAALDTYERAVAIHRELLAEQPGEADRQSELATALYDIGEVRTALGDGPRAKAAYDEALEIRKRLFKRSPDAPARQRELGQSWINRSVELVSAGQSDDAASAQAAGWDALAAALRNEPHHAVALSATLMARQVRAELHFRANRPKEARAELEAGLVLAARYQSLDPQNVLWAYPEMFIRQALARLPETTPEHFLTEARRLSDELDRMAVRDRDDYRPRFLSVKALQFEGLAEGDLANRTTNATAHRNTAVTRLATAVGRARFLCALDPDRLDFADELAWSLQFLAQAQANRGETVDSTATETESRRLRVANSERRLAFAPNDPERHRDLAERLWDFAFCFRKQEKHSDAFPLLERALAIRDALGDRTSNVAAIVAKTADVLDLLAGVRGSLKDDAGAVRDHRAALELRRRAVSLDSINPDRHSRLVFTTEQLYSALIQVGDPSADAVFLESRSARAKVTLAKVGRIANGGAASNDPVAAAYRAQFIRENLAVADRILAEAAKKYELAPSSVSTIRLAESHLGVAAVTDLATKAGVASAREHLTKALQLYERLPLDPVSQPDEVALRDAVRLAATRLERR